MGYSAGRWPWVGHPHVGARGSHGFVWEPIAADVDSSTTGGSVVAAEPTPIPAWASETLPGRAFWLAAVRLGGGAQAALRRGVLVERAVHQPPHRVDPQTHDRQTLGGRTARWLVSLEQGHLSRLPGLARRSRTASRAGGAARRRPSGARHRSHGGRL